MRFLLRLWLWLRAEIVFGVMIGTVAWIPVFGWQAAYAPTDAEKQKCYEAAMHAGRKAEECKSLWERATTDPVAFFTLWLVIFTGGLTASTIGLWIATRRTASIAERALTDLEAPFLAIQINDPGIKWGGPKRVEFSHLRYSIINYGRTPATIAELDDFVLPVPLGEFPAAMNPALRHGRPMPYGVIAPPNSATTQEFSTVPDIDFYDPDSGSAFPDVVNAAFFQGFARYRDIFGEQFIFGFCFMFDLRTHRWVLMGGKDHNYCRRESAGPQT